MRVHRDPELPEPLSRQETLALLRELRVTEDPDRRSQLEGEIVAGNLRFAAFWARRYENRGVERDELRAAASVGLLRAVRMFNVEKSDEWAAYARRCMARDLLREVQLMGGAVWVPRTVKKAHPDLSLDDPGPEPAEGTWADQTVKDGEAAALAALDRHHLESLVSELPQTWATIVRMRFGLAGCAPHQLPEIGAVLDMTKQRVHELLQKALARLRGRLLPRAA